MVNGSRQVQVLSEKENLRSGIIHVWGNYILAKLFEMKYFNLLYLGIVNLTDIGCLFRMIRRDALEKIVNNLTYPKTDEPIAGDAFLLHLTTICIENNLKVVEIPITFKKRVGVSKIESDKKIRSLKYGLTFFKYILIS